MQGPTYPAMSDSWIFLFVVLLWGVPLVGKMSKERARSFCLSRSASSSAHPVNPITSSATHVFRLRCHLGTFCVRKSSSWVLRT
ncbi:hypothetical protein BJV78DRAFT_96805 [Lactifluus subvellereus]|nr:hypothetical protein BJV78DRAFT_96805 [Lactifluus subvellereus]